MKSTANLHDDHEEIKGVLAAMRGFVQRGEVVPAVLRDAVTFSQTFVDRCHHGKEESCLFPCLEERGVPKEHGPIGMMLMEHEMGRQLVRAIHEVVGRYEAGAAAREEVLGKVEEYADLLEGHIWKEENVLFAMAAQAMSSADDARTMGCYGTVEREKVGERTHHEMTELGKRIAASRGI